MAEMLAHPDWVPSPALMLAALIRHAGKVITHRQLLQEVGGANYVDQVHYLRV